MLSLCVFLLLGAVSSQQSPECPTPEQLLSKNNYPKTRQINSETLEVEWTHLWPDMDWSTCVTSVEILVDNKVVETVSDFDQKIVQVTVEPCRDIEVVIVIGPLSGQIPEYEDPPKVKSFPSKDTKTFRPPKGMESAANNANIAYLKNDPTSVEVKLNFVDLVEDPACHKVVDVVLVVREKEELLSAETDLFVKPVGIFRHHVEVITNKLIDFCAEYEILARLIGTEGTGSTDVLLSTLGPIKDADLEVAHSAGFRHDLKVGPTDLRVQVKKFILNFLILRTKNLPS